MPTSPNDVPFRRRRRVAVATCEKQPQVTRDDQPFVDCLPETVDVHAIPWNRSGVDWADYDAVVLRSCWDYHLDPTGFTAWVQRLHDRGVALWNPAPLVLWNTEKTYLRRLQSAGIPVVPTVWLEAGARVDLSAVLKQHAWEQAVVKPVVAATAYRTWVTSTKEAPDHQTTLNGLLEDRGAMIQPFLPHIQEEGEWSLVFLDRRFSHAVLKTPKTGDFRVQHQFGGTVTSLDPPQSLQKQAQRVLDAVGGPLLYARVDGVRDGDTFRLMELELIEPVLYLESDAEAARRMAAALMAHLAE